MERQLHQTRDGQPHQAEHGNLDCDIIEVLYTAQDSVDDVLVVPYPYIIENTFVSMVAACDSITATSAISVGFRDMDTGLDDATYFADNVALMAGRTELMAGRSKPMRLREDQAKRIQLIITPKVNVTADDVFELHVYRKYHGSN